MNKLLRVVIDTNHIVSAVLSSKGASSKLIEWLTKEDDYFRLLISPPIWKEYQTVTNWLIPKTRLIECNRIFHILQIYVFNNYEFCSLLP